MTDFARARKTMVETQIAGRGIKDPRLLDAMRSVPREAFVPPDLAGSAYEDRPLPIGEGQTISQPYIVALMIEAAGIAPGQRVLEVGAGSGYAAAVLACIAAEVFGIERHARLAEDAGARLKRLGCANVAIRVDDGTLGWPEAAPFDAILAAAGGPGVPDALRDQLGPGGRLVMPVGARHGGQSLVRLTRRGETAFEREDLDTVSFVPLIGVQGWESG